MHSGSSLSLASHALSFSKHPSRRTRELPPSPSSRGYTYTREPPTTLSHISQTSYLPHRRVSLDEPPPLPASSHTSPQDLRSRISPVSFPPRRTTAPPSPSIHSRSLPVPHHIINKTADAPVAHYAQPFQSRVDPFPLPAPARAPVERAGLAQVWADP